MKPGVIERPRRSIRRVFGPASRVTSWFVPTARMRSPRTATACAIVNFSSTVMILPLVKMTSATGCWARLGAALRRRTRRLETVRFMKPLLDPLPTSNSTTPRNFELGRWEFGSWKLQALSPTRSERGFDALGREGHLPDADTGRVEDRVADRGRDPSDCGLAGAGRGHIGPIHQHRLDHGHRCPD